MIFSTQWWNMNILPILFFAALFVPEAHSDSNPAPSLEIGAKVFAERCVLCHGAEGLGEGVLPLKLKNYPNTNLLQAIKAQDRSQIYQVIVYGGILPGYAEAMPPYGQELTWTEMESVTDFVSMLRKDTNKAKQMIASHRKNELPKAQLGKQIYDTRCVLCHGKFGEGDGRMAKILKSPPPFDLTASRMPEAYLKDIISKGGEGVGRSKHMPPWGDQLNGDELEALIEYLITIRD